MLLSLAVSDMGVGLLVQPLYIALCAMDFQQVSHNAPIYNIIYISLLIPGHLFCFASFFGVTTLIADRFLAIYSYLRYQELVTHKRVLAVVIFIWVLSAILSLIGLFNKNTSYPIFGTIAFACIITATCFSVKIYLSIRRHMNQVQVLQVNQVAHINGDMANIVRLRKFAIAAVYVYLVFLLCYLPNTCTLFFKGFISESTLDKKRLELYTLTLVFLNSALNPLIYCWKMKHIRHTIKENLRNTFLRHN